jgi:hypothetical protein
MDSHGYGCEGGFIPENHLDGFYLVQPSWEDASLPLHKVSKYSINFSKAPRYLLRAAASANPLSLSRVYPDALPKYAEPRTTSTTQTFNYTRSSLNFQVIGLPMRHSRLS